MDATRAAEETEPTVIETERIDVLAILVLVIFALGVVAIVPHTHVQSAVVYVTVIPEEPGTPITCFTDGNTNYPTARTDCGVT